jgi:DNA-binding HxlR family transcriptional regulator
MRGINMRPKKTAEELKLCPGIGFSQIVGGKFKIRILWVLAQRSHRYGEIHRSLLKGTLGKAVTPRVLSRELKELQQRGLILRKQYDFVPPKVEYSITDLGRTLTPILDAIVEWGLTGVHEEILQASGALPKSATDRGRLVAGTKSPSSR